MQKTFCTVVYEAYEEHRFICIFDEIFLKHIFNFRFYIYCIFILTLYLWLPEGNILFIYIYNIFIFLALYFWLSEGYIFS